MIRRFLSISLFIVIMALISGCGGGSSSHSTPSNPSSVKSGIGYYVDSAVGGITYTCDSFSGVTDSNGSFRFEIGGECTFSLNELILHAIDMTALEDGVVIREDNVHIAQLLQGLDNDGNASNGITITEEVITHLAGVLISIPSSDEEMEALIAEVNSSVSSYGGHYVTYEEAKAHLDITPPVITLTGGAEVTVSYGSGLFVEPGISVVDDYYSLEELNITMQSTLTVDTNITGDYNLTYIAIDGAGNMATVVRTVHVVDRTAPVITVINSDIDIEVGSSLTQSDTLVGVSAEDEIDGNITVIANISHVNSSVVGNYTVLYSATDSSGNQATAEANIHVIDTTAPSISLNGSSEETIEVNQTGEYIDPWINASDNSGVEPHITVTGSVDRNTIGVYTLSYTATDDSNNTSAAISRTVSVEDTTAPSISINGDNPMNIVVGNDYIEEGASVIDNSGETLSVSISGEVNSSKVGIYYIEYSAIDDSNNSVSVSRTVNVTDNQAPVITLEGESHIDVNQSSTFTDPGANATDNYDDNVTVEVNGTVDTETVGTYTLTYTAVDSSGNEATPVTREVTVHDTTPPVITLDGDNPYRVEVNQSGNYIDPGASAVDEVDGNVTVEINSSTVNISKIGEYNVTVSAEDSVGNSVTEIREVIVEDTTPPEVTVNGNTTIEIQVNDDYVEENASAVDNSGESIEVVITGEVNSSKAGTYTITYTATDDSNNTGTATRTVSVVNGEAPTITLQGDNPYVVEVNTTYSDPGATADDAEDGNITDSVEINTTALDMNSVGNYSVSYRVVDSDGNEVEIFREVEVIDTVELMAIFDEIYSDNIETVEVAVLENDQIPSDISVDTIDILSWDENGSEIYVSELNSSDGRWYVDTNNSTVVFEPSGSFMGGTVYAQYRIIGSDTNTSIADIRIEYPLTIQANYDSVDASTIESITVNALENDEYNRSSITPTIKLVDFNNSNGEEIYVDRVERSEGVWEVDGDDNVIFIPYDNFEGGYVYMNYIISDDDGHSSRSGIQINYPIIIKANYDNIEASTVESVTINALENDEYNRSSITPTIKLVDFNDSNGEEIYVDRVERPEGVWEIDSDANVTFTPYDDFNGGYVYMNYMISDDDGHTSNSSIIINYPLIIQANYDNIDASAVESVAVNALENDEYNRSSITPTIKLVDFNDSSVEEIYVDRVERSEGVWEIDGDDNVTFTPYNDFNGGYIYIDYMISDDDGHSSKSTIQISYPVAIQAHSDYLNMSNIESVTIDVRENDEYNRSDIPDPQIQLISMELGWDTNITTEQGEWIVEDNQSVTFTPSAEFGGGDVFMEYMISDDDNHSSTSSISIDYPVVVSAYNYNIETNSTEESVVIDVMTDSYIADSNATPTVLLLNENGEWVDNVDSSNGVWSVSDTNVTFTPNDGFDDTVATIIYNLIDDDGHASTAEISIHFPLSPTPVCEKSTLSTEDEVATQVLNDINFTAIDGNREFDPKLDSTKYTIDNTLFDNAIFIDTYLNPAYVVKYSDSLNDVVAKLKLSKIEFDESNETWHYQEVKVYNHNGYKTKEQKEVDGNYTNDDDNSSYIISAIGIEYKIVREITKDEMQDSLDSAGISLTLEDNDTAQLQLEKKLIDKFSWYWTNNEHSYSSLDDLITAYSYDSSSNYLNGGLLHGDRGDVTIIFAEGSSGDSGTLVEVAWDGNALLTEEAGTWHKSTTIIDGIEHNITILEATLCGYNSEVLMLDEEGYVIHGEQEAKAGEIDAKIQFSEDLADKLKVYFVEHAILDVDPDSNITDEYIEITEENLTSQEIFYDVHPSEDNTTTYIKWDFNSSSTVYIQYTKTDSDGNITDSFEGDLDYTIEDDGKLSVDANGEIIHYGLQSADSNGWNIFDIQEGEPDRPQVWLYEEPSGFRYPDS